MPLSHARDRERKRLARAVQPHVQPTIPLYDPTRHKAGDRVLVQSPHSKRLVETVIPTLDADGHPIW